MANKYENIKSDCQIYNTKWGNKSEFSSYKLLSL